VWLRTLRRWQRNGGGGGRRCHETTRLTCAGGGTTLTSLQEGRRHAVASFRRPAILVTHSVRWGTPATRRSFDEGLGHLRRETVSSTCIGLLDHVTHL